MPLYPNGYRRSMISLDEMKRRHGAKMHPEYARRFFSWIEAQGGAMGVGGGWRKTPSDTSEASRLGRSFHQDQRFTAGGVFYCAVDLVRVNGNDDHRAPHWSEVPEQGSSNAETCGLHCNISGEPWHIQPIEIDGWQSWDAAGRPQPAAGRALPGNPPPIPIAPAAGPGGALFEPEQSQYGGFPNERNKPLLVRAANVDNDDFARYLQAVMRNQTGQPLDIDGIFGERTEAGVANVQRWNKLEEDGRCGRKTWAVIDVLATR